MVQKGVKVGSFCCIKEYITSSKNHYDAQQKQKFKSFCQTIRFQFILGLWGGPYFQILPIFLAASSLLIFSQAWFLLKWFAIIYHSLFVACAFMDPLVRGLIFSQVPVLNQKTQKGTAKLAACQLVKHMNVVKDFKIIDQDQMNSYNSLNQLAPMVRR